MEFSKVESFFRLHWPAALMVTIVSIPVIWSIASMHYSQEISALNERLITLEVQVKDLQQYKIRVQALEAEKEKVKLVGGMSEFSPESLADALFSPSIAVEED